MISGCAKQLVKFEKRGNMTGGNRAIAPTENLENMFSC